MDDVYILTGRDRAKACYDIVVQSIREHTGIEPNKGKTECWSKNGGNAPRDIHLLDAPVPAKPVWKGDLNEEDRGIEVLGSPIGTQAYINKVLDEKLAEEDILLNELPHLDKVQMAWALFYY